MSEQTFTITLASDPGFLLIEVPKAVVSALGSKKRPPVRVAFDDAYPTAIYSTSRGATIV